MKFKDMPYERPDADALKKSFTDFTGAFKAAASFEEADKIFLQCDAFQRHINTLSNLVSVRHSIDTRDEYYDKETEFWNALLPELAEYEQNWTLATLESPFRADFAKKYGDLMFINAEIALKTFSPEIIPELQRENELTVKYGKLIASAQIPFRDGVYTISQLAPFKTSPDDEIRNAAWEADGGWYSEHGAELDGIYDELTHLRDQMGKKLGYGGYKKLGYYRMGRNCYGEDDVKKFREAVRKYLVPVADRTYREQAKRLGVPYPLSFADAALSFRSGNPRPKGTADDTVAAGKKFYDELSPETSEFFRMMLDNGLMDLLSTEGKEGGGYCTDFGDYGVPFIFANFNGTQGDVEVVTHEAGHAFAAYTNRDRIPYSYMWPGMEACEVHSMSMEFIAWPWAEDFFGADADKYRYSHLAAALQFIPYGTMVDHFQHIVYENPDMSPEERHSVWKKLLGEYMPWLRLDGVIPFYSEGKGWQRQSHIYGAPFYYIDYCLAQTVSLQIWAMSREDFGGAWDHYMAYTRQGGSRVFTELLDNAGLQSPFDEKCLRSVCEKAVQWLDSFDVSKLDG